MITNINLQFNFTGSFSCFLFYTKLLTSCLGTSFSLSPSIFTRTTPDLSTMSCMLCPFRPITLAAKAQNMRITPNSLPLNIITTSVYIDEFGAYIQSGTVIQCQYWWQHLSTQAIYACLSSKTFLLIVWYCTYTKLYIPYTLHSVSLNSSGQSSQRQTIIKVSRSWANMLTNACTKKQFQ